MQHDFQSNKAVINNAVFYKNTTPTLKLATWRESKFIVEFGQLERLPSKLSA